MTVSGTNSFDMLRTPVRRRLRSLQSLVVASLLLTLPAAATTSHSVTSTPGANGAHVYLMRGLLNVFSLGLDEIAARLESQGIPVTITNYLGWESVAEEAAADYHSGKVRT